MTTAPAPDGLLKLADSELGKIARDKCEGCRLSWRLKGWMHGEPMPIECDAKSERGELRRRGQEANARASAQRPMGGEVVAESEIEKVILDFARRNDHKPIRLTYDHGPYDITSPTLTANEFAKAILALAAPSETGHGQSKVDEIAARSPGVAKATIRRLLAASEVQPGCSDPLCKDPNCTYDSQPAPVMRSEVRSAEPKRVTGCINQVEEAACLIWSELCPGMVMGDADLPHYEAAAKAVLALASRPAGATESCTISEFTNELGNCIRITIEGPTSTSTNDLTPKEATKLNEVLSRHSAGATEREVVARIIDPGVIWNEFPDEIWRAACEDRKNKARAKADAILAALPESGRSASGAEALGMPPALPAGWTQEAAVKAAWMINTLAGTATDEWRSKNELLVEFRRLAFPSADREGGK